MGADAPGVSTGLQDQIPGCEPAEACCFQPALRTQHQPGKMSPSQGRSQNSPAPVIHVSSRRVRQFQHVRRAHAALYQTTPHTSPCDPYTASPVATSLSSHHSRGQQAASSSSPGANHRCKSMAGYGREQEAAGKTTNTQNDH